MTTTEHIQSNQDLICEFNDLLNSDPDFNYSENEFNSEHELEMIKALQLKLEHHQHLHLSNQFC